jgi:hypothetical protein
MIVTNKNTIIHTHYTPNTKQFLWSHEYQNVDELKKYFKENSLHYFEKGGNLPTSKIREALIGKTIIWEAVGDDSTFNKNQEFVVEAVDVEKNERTNKWVYIIRYVAKDFKPQNRLSRDQITELVNAGKVNIWNSGQPNLKIKDYNPDFAKGGDLKNKKLYYINKPLYALVKKDKSVTYLPQTSYLFTKQKDGNYLVTMPSGKHKNDVLFQYIVTDKEFNVALHKGDIVKNK